MLTFENLCFIIASCICAFWGCMGVGIYKQTKDYRFILASAICGIAQIILIISFVSYMR